MIKKEHAYFVGALFIILASIALYATFSFKTCYAYGCFQERMQSCKFSTFINEEQEASWKYDIQGKSGKNCQIQVTLLQAKEGDLNLKDYEGDSMVCSYSLGTSAYPEKDMSKCHGLLKEDLQTVLINKLHEYVVNNLDTIDKALSSNVA